MNEVFGSGDDRCKKLRGSYNPLPTSIPNEYTADELVTGWASSTTSTTSPVVAASRVAVPTITTTTTLSRLVSVFLPILAFARWRVLWAAAWTAAGLVCGTVP